MWISVQAFHCYCHDVNTRMHVRARASPPSMQKECAQAPVVKKKELGGPFADVVLDKLLQLRMHAVCCSVHLRVHTQVMPTLKTCSAAGTTAIVCSRGRVHCPGVCMHAYRHHLRERPPFGHGHSRYVPVSQFESIGGQTNCKVVPTPAKAALCAQMQMHVPRRKQGLKDKRSTRSSCLLRSCTPRKDTSAIA